MCKIVSILLKHIEKTCLSRLRRVRLCIWSSILVSRKFPISSISPGNFFEKTVDLTNADNFTASPIRLSFKMVEIINCENPNSHVMAITDLPLSCREIILSFISRVIAFLFFTSEAGSNTVHYRALVVYPLDHMADWELWLTASARHHTKILYHIQLAQEKIKTQNSKYSFYGMWRASVPS